MQKKNALRRSIVAGIGLVACASLTVGASLPAAAGNGGRGGGHGGGHGTSLVKAVKGDKVMKHLEALQAIADANGGTRVAGSAGYTAAAEYIEAKLRKAGYEPIRQPFSYDQFVEASSSFEQLAPTATSYVDQTDYDVMDYSGAGDVSGAVVAVDINLVGDRASTSGCEAADFAGFPAGSVALIQRGTCTFGDKVANAAAAGATGVVLFNQGNGEDRSGLLFGTLAAPQAPIPAVGTTFALGEALAGTLGATVRVVVDASTETIETFNILADSKGSADRTVVVGAHLDSVSEGPGINDNGSGSAAILETAIQLGTSPAKPQNRVRFAFWSGEEDGLLGSTHYVEQLTDAEIAQHAANLNFDMVASPNFARFVYDGDGSAFGDVGPDGSAEIEKLFEDFFASNGLASEPTAFDGRSDYFAFIDAGIPAGGLFTGAEGVMTEEQAALYGGTAGEPYDPCYHQACDTIENINSVALDQMADAIAHATETYADTKAPGHGRGWGHGKGHDRGHGDQDRQGSHFRK